MKQLQNYYLAAVMAEFDEATGRLVEGALRKGYRPRVWDFEGFYALIGSETVVIFRRDDNVMVMRICGCELVVSPELQLDIRLGPNENLRILTVRNQGQNFAEIAYDPMEHPPPPLFGYYDAEDYDFALFLMIVSRDPAKQQRLFRKTTS